MSTSYVRSDNTADEELHAPYRAEHWTAQTGCNVSKSTRNSNTRWTANDVKALARLADGNTPTRVIGFKLGRTETAVRSKASEENISLSPTNQSPYGTQK